MDNIIDNLFVIIFIISLMFIKIKKMDEKLRQVGKYWGSDHQSFEGYGWIDLAELRQFYGSHPSIIERWLMTEVETHFEQDARYQITFRNYRNRVRFWIEDRFGIEISKKHYRCID